MVDLAEKVRLHVSVTQDDIRRGVPNDPCRCPVARALNRAADTLGYDAAVSAYLTTLTVDGEKSFYYSKTPGPVGKFVQDFDAGAASDDPFEFDIGFTLSSHPGIFPPLDG